MTTMDIGRPANVKAVDRRLFLGVFVYVLLTGLAVQFVLLPHIFPQLHAGDGLLVGLDAAGFHASAVELMNKIREQGWSAWVFRPDGYNTPPSILAIIYTLSVPKPYILLPLNAMLWASNAWLWARILRMIYPALGHWALLGALLITVLPSTFAWTTQFLKDIISIPGVTLMVYAFVRAATLAATRAWLPALLEIALALLIGAGFIWLVRPYLLQLAAAGCFAGFCVVMIGAVWRAVSLRQLASVGIVMVAIAALAVIGNRTASESAERLDVTMRVTTSDAAIVASAPEIAPVPSENKTVALLNRLAHIVLVFRMGYCSGDNLAAGSAIDCDWPVRTAAEAVGYFPRALQLVLFAPFPSHWFGEAKSAGGGMMRLIAGVEMTINYLLFAVALLMVGLRRARVNVLMVAVAAFLVVPALIIIYSNPNLGTVYRMRYIYLEGIVALAACVALSGWLSVRLAARNRTALAMRA